MVEYVGASIEVEFVKLEKRSPGDRGDVFECIT